MSVILFIALQAGFKPAGGIRTCSDAFKWLALMLRVLGDDYTKPGRFRFGASGLLTDLEKSLYFLLSDGAAPAASDFLVA